MLKCYITRYSTLLRLLYIINNIYIYMYLSIYICIYMYIYMYICIVTLLVIPMYAQAAPLINHRALTLCVIARCNHVSMQSIHVVDLFNCIM